MSIRTCSVNRTERKMSLCWCEAIRVQNCAALGFPKHVNQLRVKVVQSFHIDITAAYIASYISVITSKIIPKSLFHFFSQWISVCWFESNCWFGLTILTSVYFQKIGMIVHRVLFFIIWTLAFSSTFGSFSC